LDLADLLPINHSDRWPVSAFDDDRFGPEVMGSK